MLNCKPEMGIENILIFSHQQIILIPWIITFIEYGRGHNNILSKIKIIYFFIHIPKVRQKNNVNEKKQTFTSFPGTRVMFWPIS